MKVLTRLIPVRYVVGISIVFLIAEGLSAQNIPIGTWRTHLSYHQIYSIALGTQRIFAAANHGVMVLDQRDNSMSTSSKINGLNGTTVSYIEFDSKTQRLVVSYADGKFDVIDNQGTVYGFDPTKNSTLSGSKKINHIHIEEGIAYLSTDYGVMVFDLSRLLVRETWRGLGNNGEVLSVFQSAILGDTIFLATGKGVIAGALEDNLQDFNNWKRFEAGNFNGAVQHIANFHETVYAGVNESGLFVYENAHWTKTAFLDGFSFASLHSSGNNLFISATLGLYKLDGSNNLSQITDQNIQQPNFATEDDGGKVWIGDGINGLITNTNGSFASTIPNSPFSDQMFNLSYGNFTMYAVAGGYSPGGTALGNLGRFDSFRDGLWTNELSTLNDLTGIITDPQSGKIYISSFGYGIETRDFQNNSQLFNDTNSPLMNANPGNAFVNIPALATGTNGVWVLNYAVSKPLHFLDANNTWKSFSFPLDQSKYPLKLAVDYNGSVWMGLDPVKGGITVFNENENKSVVLTDLAGSGGLPSNSVNEVTIDRDGLLWIGTDLGVAYFNDPASVFSGNVNAIKPIYDGRFLLRDDKVTSIAVDGGNRKWIGTQRGLWLFNESGEELIYNFTTKNSPLLSDVIRDVEVDGQTGEVFIATNEGLVSFRSDATNSKGGFETVKVFPNPVTKDFVGSIGISGLATDALVKITDVNGRLIWQTRANGGTASWNLQDVNGRRPSTGVYMVFAVTEDGHDSVVAKIAFVD